MKELTNFFKDRFLVAHSEKLERKILVLLRKDYEPEKIFEKIKNNSDVMQVSRFLYNSGLDKTLLDFSAEQLNKQKPIAWPFVLRLFIKHKIVPKAELGKIIFHRWLKKKENQSEALFACKEWGGYFSEFEQLRLVYLQELEDKNFSEENELLDQLAFVQAQNLIKEEEEIITKLLLINPSNSKYQKIQKELNEKKAILTIQKHKKWSQKTDRLKDHAVCMEKSALNEDWLKVIVQTVKQDPKKSKNLSLFLYFCDSPNKALDILGMHVGQMSDYWFYLDWVLETKQYTKGLELINHLVLEVKESAVFFMPLIYIKSQMLYGLGKKAEAIEYLTAISQIQPTYKSVQYFLEKWSKEV